MRIFPFSKYAGNKGVFLYCLFFILIPFSSKAQSDKKIVKYALQAEDEGAYDQAVLYFQSLASLEKLSISQLLVYLDCLVKRRDLDQANQLTELIENKTKGSPPVLYYLIKGDLDHQNTDFDEAITHYKKFIRLADTDDPLRDSAKDRLLTCSYARRNNSWKDGVGILPFAKGINSSGDEVKPIFSKNLNGVFYFGAANNKSIGGRRDALGKVDEQFGQFKIDMIKAQRSGESTFSVSPLSYLLNSPSNDILAGFSEDGQVLYFGKGNSLDMLLLHADTFEQDISKRKLKSDPYSGLSSVFSRLGLPCFYSDKVVLFASDELPGYGGYDLFVTYLIGESWSKPENLGPAINTVYNEVSPFLAKNGRALYFSTDNPNISFGGYDIVHSVFKVHSFSWSEVKNMGKPVNSCGNDLDFSLSNNGVSALFSSDRAGGAGGYDLYNVLFQQQVEEQLTQLSAFVFGKNFESIDSDGPVATEAISMRPVYYGGDSDLLSNSNKDYLVRIARRLSRDRQLRLILNVHSNDIKQNQTNAYLSYQRGLKIRTYLEDFGVYKEQISIRSFSNYFPLAIARDGEKESYYGQRANNRVDLSLWSMDDEFIEEPYAWPKLDSISRDSAFDGLSEFLNGISYSVEVFQSNVNQQDPILFRYSPLIINSVSGGNQMSFQLGMFKSIGQAKTLLNSLELLGYTNAQVSVFLNGYELVGEELDVFRGRFPGISWP